MSTNFTCYNNDLFTGFTRLTRYYEQEAGLLRQTFLCLGTSLFTVTNASSLRWNILSFYCLIPNPQCIRPLSFGFCFLFLVPVQWQDESRSRLRHLLPHLPLLLGRRFVRRKYFHALCNCWFSAGVRTIGFSFFFSNHGGGGGGLHKAILNWNLKINSPRDQVCNRDDPVKCWELA